MILALSEVCIGCYRMQEGTVVVWIGKEERVIEKASCHASFEIFRVSSS